MPDFFATHFAFLTSPEGWAAMVTLIAMEVVLGIDNLIFISILTNKLPVEHRRTARRLGIGAALIMRLLLLATISWIVAMTAPVFSAFGHGFSWRDLILIGGGLFLIETSAKLPAETGRARIFPSDGPAVTPACARLGALRRLSLLIWQPFLEVSRVPHPFPESAHPGRRCPCFSKSSILQRSLIWKATREIHHTVDPSDHKDDMVGHAVSATLGGAIFQILLLDLVFSVDSIITAVGMTDYLVIMYIAVIVAITVMLIASDPVADFIERNPTIVMLALGFLLMIGTTLIADGLGFHVPKGYIYSAMAFSALVEGLNMLARRRIDPQGDTVKGLRNRP